MFLVLLYSVLLIFGIGLSQLADLLPVRNYLGLAAEACLAYIMIEVGLEFTLDRAHLKSYGRDFMYASAAAAVPWLLCAAYLFFVFKLPVPYALLVGIFAAPTSAGILMAMLKAGGLARTWVFKQVQSLAIFDDIVTIVLLAFLQIMLIGPSPALAEAILLILGLLWAAYAWQHSLKLPSGQVWLAAYAVVVTAAQWGLHHAFGISIGVILPAFVLGAVLVSGNVVHDTDSPDRRHSRGLIWMDRAIKGFFMFLVGCSLPRVEVAAMAPWLVAAHVLALLILSNLGKCFLVLCYRDEASLRARWALSVAMFPRGEVGAGVLLMAIGYGMKGLVIAIPVLSLALNLLLTGVFILVVLKLLKSV
jgi:Kef-type K+ transport system membrane component KefB